MATAIAPTSPQQAELRIEGDPDPIVCWFNPTEYGVTKSNKWEVKPVAGRPLPDVQFGGGDARQLTLSLLFDASDSPNQDVVAVCNRLFKLMEVNPTLTPGGSGGSRNDGRPPKVTFAWGRVLTFQAVVTQLGLQFTLFRPDGTPIRAQASITLVQVEAALQMSSAASSAKRQNPTTTGVAGRSAHVVRAGDSLASIAYAAYDDPTRWREIALANGVDDPLRLEPGTLLAIPGERP
jgi:hypothetical protein